MDVHSGWFAHPQSHHDGWFKIYRGKRFVEFWAGHRWIMINW